MEKERGGAQVAGKKAVLFVMVDDTRNCDEVGEYLQKICPELQGAVLVIHTKNNGEISEAASGKNKEELELLRKEANAIDTLKSPYKAIVSVLMLKEGWDVRNVTVICGLRAYAAKSNILPEQTLGRGLRRMYFGNDVVRETVSVMGTPAFMEFVESIKSEGVTFEHVPMGGGTTRHDSLIVEVDTESEEKNLDELDIPLPKLTRRYQREFKNLDALDPAKLGNQTLALKPFTEEETREIIFKQMLDAAVHHTIRLDGVGTADYRSVVAFFARQLLKDLRLVGGYEVLYPKVRDFMRDYLFSPSPVNLEDPVVLRNLSEPDAGKILYDAFKVAINALTVQETGTTHIEDRIRLKEMRPFRTEWRQHLPAEKCIFNRIVGEPNSGAFELRFAAFLEDAADVQAFAKNYLAVGFKLDYVKANGDLSNYTPDFIVRTMDRRIWIVETKGREELISRRRWPGSGNGARMPMPPRRTGSNTDSSSWMNSATRSTSRKHSHHWLPALWNTEHDHTLHHLQLQATWFRDAGTWQRRGAHRAEQLRQDFRAASNDPLGRRLAPLGGKAR